MKSILELLWGNELIGDGNGLPDGEGDTPNGESLSDGPQFCLELSCTTGGGGTPPGCDGIAIIAFAYNCGI